MSDEPSVAHRRRVGEALGRLWWLPLLRGILCLLLGCYALFRPGLTLAALAQVVGIFVIVDGALAILVGLIGTAPSRLWAIVHGVLKTLVGLFVIANPILVAGVTATILVYLLAFAAIAGGILEVIGSIQDRKTIEGEGWLAAAGALTILFGVVLLMAPLFFGLLMVRVLGGFSVFFGASLFVFAFRVRRIGNELTQWSQQKSGSRRLGSILWDGH